MADQKDLKLLRKGKLTEEIKNHSVLFNKCYKAQWGIHVTPWLKL